MNKRWLYILFINLFAGCTSQTNNCKQLDLGSFKISIPKEWSYKHQDGVDSYVGEIAGKNVSMDFDYSGMGYANHLLPTEQEYLQNRQWRDDCRLCEIAIPFSQGKPGSESEKYINPPSAQQKIKFPKADYIAKLSYKDSLVYAPIYVPEKIKQSNIMV